MPEAFLTSALRILTPPALKLFKEKWDDKKAFDHAKNKLSWKYKGKLYPIDYDEITHTLKITRKDIISIPYSKQSLDIHSFLLEICKEKITDFIYDKKELVLYEFVDEFIDKTLEYYLIAEYSIVNKEIIDLLYQIINNQYKQTQYLISLYELLDQPDYETFKNFLKNDILYFVEAEKALLTEIQNILLKRSENRKPILISGIPESGKTYLSLFLAYQLIKKNYITYYIRLDEPLLDYTKLYEELLDLSHQSEEKQTLIIFDNCHNKIDIFKNLAKRYKRCGNLNYLFVSRELQKSDMLDTYSDLNLLEFFSNYHFKINSKNFVEKAKGLILKYKQYRETESQKKFEIGKVQFVINNAHQSLVALNVNLKMWQQNLPLDQVNKRKVFQELYNKYLANEKELSFILIIASLYKYEIYLDASEKYFDTAMNLYKKGIVIKEEYSNYYHLFHSSFAKLLLNVYTEHIEFGKRYKGLDDLIYNKISEYILSFKKYPQNLDNIFYYLNINHGLKNIGINLLRSEDIIQRFFDFHNENRINVELYLFLLYRLSKLDIKITERLCTEISNDIWKKNLMEMSFSRFSLSLFHLDRVSSDKARSVLNSLELSELVQKIKSGNVKFHLLTNSIREIVKISGTKNLGIQILNNLSINYLVNGIRTTNLVHLGKTVSELHATSPQIAEEVVKNIDSDFISRLIKNSDLKSYSKSLNEIKKAHPQLANIFFNNTPNDALIEQLLKMESLEGISRSLTELSKIDMLKAKELYNIFPQDKIITLIYHSSVIQIAQSLSELQSIDKKDELHKRKISKIFWELDKNILCEKIHVKSARFHQIGDAMSLFFIIDYEKNKINQILEKIDKLNLLYKAAKSTFHEFCLGLPGIYVTNDNLSTYIINNTDINLILKKANEDEFEFIGSDLNRISKINKTLTNELLKKINWEGIINRSKNIKFTKLVDSLTALAACNKIFAKNLIQKIQLIFGTMFFINRAKFLNRNALLDSLTKLNTIDKKLVEEIVLALRKNGYI